MSNFRNLTELIDLHVARQLDGWVRQAVCSLIAQYLLNIVEGEGRDAMADHSSIANTVFDNVDAVRQNDSVEFQKFLDQTIVRTLKRMAAEMESHAGGWELGDP